jgi:hypothetical protein
MSSGEATQNSRKSSSLEKANILKFLFGFLIVSCGILGVSTGLTHATHNTPQFSNYVNLPLLQPISLLVFLGYTKTILGSFIFISRRPKTVKTFVPIAIGISVLDWIYFDLPHHTISVVTLSFLLQILVGIALLFNLEANPTD